MMKVVVNRDKCMNEVVNLVSVPWSLVPSHCSLVIGHGSLSLVPMSLVPGHWSLVIGPWSLVPGPWSLPSIQNWFLLHWKVSDVYTFKLYITVASC